VESSVKNLAYRISHTFGQQDGFPAASGADNGTDFLHSNKANARINWTLASGSNLELFAGGTWENDGTPNDLPQQQAQYNEHFEMLKVSQKLGSHSTVEILSSRNNYITDESPSFPSGTGQFSVLQYDEEILQRWQWADERLNTTYGVNYRNAAVNSPAIFAGNPDQRLELWSGYLNQSAQLSKTVSLTGGASWESSSVGAGGLQTNYQAATLWAPLENHSFRASYAVAHTIPSLFTTAAHDQFNQVVLSMGNPELKPQTLTSYEIGHRGTALEKHVQMDTSLFYTVIHNMDSTVVQSAVFFPQPAITLTSTNDNQAIARGVETEVKYRFDARSSLYLNYTYEHISDWIDDRGSITRNTPAHKVNLGGIADLGHGFSGSVNLGYKDNYFITSVGRSVSAVIPAYWRLDVRIAYAINSKIELFMAGQNLAASTHQEFADGLTVPRTYEGGISMKFGGAR
jgi:outer membrane receptor protein involved in Fe transport